MWAEIVLMIKSVSVNRHKTNAMRIVGMTAAGSKVVAEAKRTEMMTPRIMKMLVDWFLITGETEWSCQFRPDAYQKFLKYLRNYNGELFARFIELSKVHYCCCAL